MKAYAPHFDRITPRMTAFKGEGKIFNVDFTQSTLNFFVLIFTGYVNNVELYRNKYEPLGESALSEFRVFHSLLDGGEGRRAWQGLNGRENVCDFSQSICPLIEVGESTR